MKKKILIVLAVVIALFVFTNPNPEDFKTFIIGKYNLKTFPSDRLSNGDGWVTYGRTSNFLVFSVYTYTYHLNNDNHTLVSKTFTGIVKNFF